MKCWPRAGSSPGQGQQDADYQDAGENILADDTPVDDSRDFMLLIGLRAEKVKVIQTTAQLDGEERDPPEGKIDGSCTEHRDHYRRPPYRRAFPDEVADVL